jgi:hypothetical protein
MSEDEEKRGASFNMAVATLARLDGILKRMEIVSEFVSGIKEQRLHIKLLRHFFINATPLLAQALKTSEINKYKERVTELRIPTKLIRGRRAEYYDAELSNKIIDLITDIQIEIKEHFMPRKEEDDDEL